jgi:hypothetical protein
MTTRCQGVYIAAQCWKHSGSTGVMNRMLKLRSTPPSQCNKHTLAASRSRRRCSSSRRRLATTCTGEMQKGGVRLGVGGITCIQQCHSARESSGRAGTDHLRDIPYTLHCVVLHITLRTARSWSGLLWSQESIVLRSCSVVGVMIP